MKNNLITKKITLVFVLTLFTCQLLLGQVRVEPVKVVGQFDHSGDFVTKYLSISGSAVLLCMSRSLRGPSDEWTPKAEQILGRFVSPFYPSPLKYEMPLPIAPTCSSVDLDNNGRTDQGVKVFAVITAVNMFGDTFLEQIEQETGYGSYIYDPAIGTVRSGTFLIFAPDDAQRISSGFGKDGKLFTNDDPTVPVAKGYSTMKVSADSTVTFEQKNELRIDIAVGEEAKSPDLSKQGLLQSFDSLVDILKQRYAYTKLRGIDWEKKRAEFRPRFVEADKRQDLGDYYEAVFDFAASMVDGHVQTGSFDPKLTTKRRDKLIARFGANLGARVIRYSDERFVVFSVAKDSAADKAGFKIGTEILKVNGKDVVSFLKTVPRLSFAGTEERLLANAANLMFLFPKDESVTIEYRQPGETATKTATLVADKKHEVADFPSLYPYEPLTMKLFEEGKIGYIRWSSFENVPVNIAGWEYFLDRSYGNSGIIVDLRGNGGGLAGLMYTMASYLYHPDKPVSTNWLDTYLYDDKADAFVKESGAGKRKLSSPKGEAAYLGNVVVLVDGASASAAEFFAQFLQKTGRAVVIADSGTDGAGGSVRAVTLPGNFPFGFTGGQMYYAGTKEVNLEGKGVTADVRVQITDEYVRTRLNGGDPVVDFAIEYLKDAAKRATPSK